MGFNDGQFYEGSLQFGLYHGEGKLTMSNDEVRPGPWIHGVRKLETPTHRRPTYFHEQMLHSSIEAQNKFTPHNSNQIDQCLSVNTKDKGMVITLNSTNCFVKHMQSKKDYKPSSVSPVLESHETRQQKMKPMFHIQKKCNRCQ